MQVSSGGAKTRAQNRRKPNTSSLGTSTIHTESLTEDSTVSRVFFFVFFRRHGTADKRTPIHPSREELAAAACPVGAELDGVWLEARAGERAGQAVWTSNRMSRLEPNRGKQGYRHLQTKVAQLH